jgi:diguanylate cyclase (GGDEF)-like protein
VIIDIDHFKELVAQTNSEFGLMVNNDFGRMLPQLLRDADIGSRAQDRYYLLLPNTDAAGAVFLVGRIKEALEKMNFQFAGVTFSVTASAGIATFPDPQSDAKALLPCALKALDAAKAGGRNRAIIHGSGTGTMPAS